MQNLLFFFIPSFLNAWNCDKKDISETSTEMKINWLSSIDPLAVCNDGTPGAYYFSSYLNKEFEDTYIIHLPGGAQCWDQQSCETRWNSSGTFQMSSQGFKSICYKTGILDSSQEMTPLWAANKVMVGYCSSDGYMGDANASNSTWGWHMRGQRLVYATIKDLILRHGLSNKSKIFQSFSKKF